MSKNIILQHWSGTVDELTYLSTENIKAYANFCGADYQFLRDDVFQVGLTSPCQKVAMLNEEFDQYEDVVMMDADMFTKVGLEKNIFEESGMGRHYGIQTKLVINLCRRFPLLGNSRYPYWGGSIYKFNKEDRKRLRKNIRPEETIQFSGNYEDEGIMHRLAVLSDFRIGAKTYFDRDLWNMSSFEPNLDEANIVHIRPKRVQGGKKYKKLDNYKILHDRGII